MTLIERLFGTNKKAQRLDSSSFQLQYINNVLTIFPTDRAGAMKYGFKGNSTVYSIITKCASKFATIPWYVYKVKNGQRAKQYTAATQQFGIGPQTVRLKVQAFDEVENENDPAVKLWHHPNGWQTGGSFRELALTYKLIYGGVPIYADMGVSKTKVQQIMCLPPQFTNIYPDSNLMAVDRAELQVTGMKVDIPRDQLFYWVKQDPDFKSDGAHLYGLSPLKALSRSLAADNYNLDAQAFLFEHKGATGIFTPKDMQATMAIQSGPGGLDGLRVSLDELLQRSGSPTRRPFINAPLDYQTFGMDADELRTIESHQLLKEDFCNAFDFPALLMMTKSSTDNNYNHSIKYLVTNTIYGSLVEFRDYMNQWLWPLAGLEGYYVDFDLTELPEMQEDVKQLADWLIKTWVIAPNEVRVALKYDKLPIPTFDEPWVPGGLMPASQAAGMDSANLNDVGDYGSGN
jgi:HK97 family phage portal protein